MAITHLPIRMQLGGFPMFPPGMGPSIGMPRGGMGQVRRPPPPSDADEGGRRAPTPYSLEDLSPRHFQAPRAPNLFVGGPSVYNPFQSFPSFGGYGGNLPQVPRYGGRTGGSFGPPPPPRGYPMGGGMPGFGPGAMPFRPRPRPQAPQFDFDEDQLRSFFQQMMGPQDTSEMTALQDRIKELEGQISGFQTPGGVEEETTVTETETIPTPTPTPTPQVPTPTPQDAAWQLPPEIQEQIDALQVDIPNINLPGLGRTEPNGELPSSTIGNILPPIPEFDLTPSDAGGGMIEEGPPQLSMEELEAMRQDIYVPGSHATWNRMGINPPPAPPAFDRFGIGSGAGFADDRVPTTTPPVALPPIDTLPPPIPFGPGHPLFDPPREDRGSVVPRMPQQPGPKIRPRPRPPGGRGPGAPINIPRQPRINMEQLLAGLGGLGPGGP